MQTVPETETESELAARLAGIRVRLLEELHRVIVGQDEVLEHLMIAMLCRGHVLIEGVPGLAKTVMVQTLARVLGLSFARVQFTPDLMPSDITGTDILQEDPQTGRRQFEFMPGPLFASLVLADEINRTPPKTQAALLEAMQERRVTVRGRTYELPDPFFVLATQNPIEQEGTYPLPEAQLDRFLFHIRVGYPSAAEEIEILKRTTTAARPTVTPVFTARELVQVQDLVRQVPVADEIYAAVVRLVQATRPGAAVPDVSEWLQWGAGPRAGQVLILGAKARALLHGRFHATLDDVYALAIPTLRHRLVPGFAAAARGLTSDALIERLVRNVATK